ncbi:MAG: T9SS type A sorting domain-containing protein [FCB group bacterium]|nr:T9SS type A sorting domain-containing protein [FCB group bacterium]
MHFNMTLSSYRRVNHISPAYPNPFNPETTISFRLPETQVVRIVIYDISGKKITELANTEYSAGSHSIIWNASEIGSGMYFYRLNAGSFASTGKLMLVK